MAKNAYTAELEFINSELGEDFKNLPDAQKAYYNAGGSGGGGSEPVAWDDVTGKPETFPPVIGTTADTAKAGNYQPTWAQVTGKPAVIAAGADAAAARTAIGAGTSNLAIGTTADTAAAGNHNHAVTADADSGLAAAANIQALAVALSARIKALEDAAA